MHDEAGITEIVSVSVLVIRLADIPLRTWQVAGVATGAMTLAQGAMETIEAAFACQSTVMGYKQSWANSKNPSQEPLPAAWDSRTKISGPLLVGLLR